MLAFNIYKHDKYNLCEFESNRNLDFSAFQFLWAVEISRSVELSINKVL